MRDLRRRAAFGRQRNLLPAGQVAAGQRRLRVSATSLRRALRDDRAARAAGPRAHVDQVVARPHQRFVVLDDDDRVALLLQIAQRGDQPIVVARMQADRRLVEQIQHADQPRADAGRQPHALPFAAAERVGGAIEREVLGADAIEKLPAGARSRPRSARRSAAGRRANVKLAKELDRRRDRERRDFVNRQAAQPARPRLRPQAACRCNRDSIGCSRRSGGWGRGSGEPPVVDWAARCARPQPPRRRPITPKPVARRARAVRAVEAERPRLDLADARSAVRAGVARVEQPLLPAACRPLGLLPPSRSASGTRRCTTPSPCRTASRTDSRQPRVDAVANHEPIDHRLDVVHLLRRERRDLVERIRRRRRSAPARSPPSESFRARRDARPAGRAPAARGSSPAFRSGRPRIVCSISASVCCAIGVPHFGHSTSPTRAISSRR